MTQADHPARIPPEIISPEDYERAACDILDAGTWAYISGGAGGEISLRANRRAFDTTALHGRIAAPPSVRTDLTLLGADLAHPILLAPVGHLALAHPQAEKAAARAAAAMEGGMVISARASTALADICDAAPGVKWLQIYFEGARDAAKRRLRDAEAHGLRAIVLTLDAPAQALSRRAVRAGFRFPPAAHLESAVAPGLAAALARAPAWDDILWLIRESGLPVIAKGVSHPEDAARLADAGAAAIIASNHGGRALDGAVAPLRSLPALRRTLGDAFCLLMDGGVRSGADVLKAIANGANAVLIGRPYVYALAVAGDLGVAHLLRLMREELELAMALTGCARLADITPAVLAEGADPCCS